MEYLKSENKYIVRIDRGEEILEKLNELCKKEDITLAGIYGIGACDYVKIGLFNVETQNYTCTELHGMMEITSLTGNVTTKDGEIYLHLHINVADEELKVRGGHLNACRIAATCEIILTTVKGSVTRKVDPVIGLNVFDFQ